MGIDLVQQKETLALSTSDLERLSKPADSLQELAWQFFVENHGQIIALAYRIAKGDHELADELYEEATKRIPRLVETWDPDRGPALYAFVMHMCRRYMYKVLAHKRKQAERYADGSGETLAAKPCHRAPCPAEQAERSDVERAVYEACASDMDRYLLEARFVYGLTTREISVQLGPHPDTGELIPTADIKAAIDKVIRRTRDALVAKHSGDLRGFIR